MVQREMKRLYAIVWQLLMLLLCCHGQASIVSHQVESSAASMSGKKPNQIKPITIVVVPDVTEYKQPINLGKVNINSPITASQFHFSEPINMHGTEIVQSVVLDYSKFENIVDLNDITFGATVDSAWVILQQNFTCDYCRFKQNVYLGGSLFEKNFILTHSHLFGGFTANLSHFGSKVLFNHDVFHQDFNLSGANFSKSLLMLDSSFEKNAKFSHAMFRGPVKLSLSHFNQDLDLSYAKIFQGMEIEAVSVGHMINLKHVDIEGGHLSLVNVTPVQHGKKILINLTNTNLDNIDLDFRHLKLYFSAMTSYNNQIYTYNIVLNYLKARGHTEEFKTIYKEFKEFKYLHHKQDFRNSFHKHFWQYGLDRSTAFYWLGVLFLVFTLINSAFYLSITEHYFSLNFLDINEDEPRNLNFFVQFIYFLPHALLLTFFLFISGFVKTGYTEGRFSGGNIIVMIYLLSIMVSGYACLFFLLSYLLNIGAIL